MKKIFFFLSAIALLGLTAACVEQQPVNPNYDAATNSVKTAFTFNIAATSPQTKSTAATAQYVAEGVPTFRGMTNMTLFAYAQGTATTEIDFTTGTMYNLGTLDAGVIGNTDEKPSHKIYPLSIPVGTDRMVFYAKAKKTSTDVEEGITNFPAATAWTSKDDVEFSLSPRLTATTYSTTAQAIANALNTILSAEFTPTAPAGQTPSAITWKQLVSAQDMDSKYATFKAVYDAVVPVRQGEIRAGSAPAVLHIASDIYKAMNVLSVNSTDDDVDELAKAISDKIKINFNTDDSDVTGWKNTTNIDANFPTNLNLPAGAAQLSYTANGGFAPVTDPVLDPANVTGSAVAVANFMYPAELCYWSASKINVTDVDKTDADYPKTTTAWDGTPSWSTDWTIEGTVKASTKAVAMKNNIHYGTALLATTVKYDKDNIPVKENKLALVDSNNEDILVADNGLLLTGILVGKQSSKMGWNFISKDNTFDKIVYDNAIVDPNLKINGNTTKPNYTLLFDSNGANSAQDKFVLVALEFQNKTGKDFMGLNNLIPKDGTFYLVGKLDLTDKNGAPLEVTLPTGDYAIPGNNTYRAFIQDYVTNANFKIGKESLKKAYYTVPDLRSTQMTFGLSVDLMWKTGHSFDVTFE